MDVIFKFLKDNWHQPWTPVILFVLGVSSVFFLRQYIDTEKFSFITNTNIGAFILGVFFVGIWYWSHRIPKTKKGKIGLIIAITSEEESDSKQISWDFVRSIQEILEDVKEFAPFEVIELPKFHAQKIIDPESAKKYVAACNGRFLVFGQAKRRKIASKEHHVLKLRGLVVHNPIPMDNSNAFAHEMNDVLPTNIGINCENDLKEFELTSLWFSESGKFIIGTAALLSGDYSLAQFLLEDLNGKSSELRKHKKAPGISKLLSLIPGRLADIYLATSRREFLSWRENRDIAHLENAKKYCDMYDKIIPNTLNHKLISAIWAFVNGRNIESAKNLLNSCKARFIQDSIWRFGVAFLEAYSGNLAKAEEQYNAGITLLSGHELPFEVEEFIEWVLQEEPNKYQLYYCLGIINEKAKNDLEAAKKDFLRFLELLEDGKFAIQATIAERKINEIDQLLHVKNRV